jgi:hypothetical protein
MEVDRDLSFQNRASYCEDAEDIPVYTGWVNWNMMRTGWHWKSTWAAHDISASNAMTSQSTVFVFGILVFLCVHARSFHLSGLCLHTTHLARYPLRPCLLDKIISTWLSVVQSRSLTESYILQATNLCQEAVKDDKIEASSVLQGYKP